MNVHQTDFSTGSVYRNIIEVAVPMILAQLLNLLYNVVDRVYIGRIPEVGTLALTGVGLCFPIISLVTAFTYLFGNGGAPLCAIERGKGNKEEAEKLMGNAFYDASFDRRRFNGCRLVVLPPGFVSVWSKRRHVFICREAIFGFIFLGTIFVMISVGMNPFINSQGFGNTGMFSVLIGAVLNIILDPVFIFGFGMGVEGAAVATILSQFFFFCCMGSGISDRKKSSDTTAVELYEASGGKSVKNHEPWRFRFHYGIYQQSGSGSLQCNAPDLWRRYLCRCYDCVEFRTGYLYDAGYGICKWSVSGL